MNSKTFTKDLFGGKVDVLVYDPNEETDKIIEKMHEEAVRLQKIFNFFDSESELSLLNKKRQMKISKEFLEVLKKSLRFAKLTKGRYDPTLGKQIMRRKSQQPEERLYCSYKDVKISFNKITLKSPDAMIDLGSIAKGYITDKLSDFLKKKGIKEFVINSRGDITFSGNLEHVIGIENPRKRYEALEKIKLKDTSVATSGDYNQFYGDRKNSHILNSTNAISITVVSEELEDADVLATVLFVSNEEERRKIMQKYKKSKALIVKENLNKKNYNNFEKIIEK